MQLNKQLWPPYYFLLELEEYVISKDNGSKFSESEFMDIHRSFEYFETERGQRKLLALFKSLPRAEIINRASSISKLSQLLIRIRTNKRS